MSIIHVVSVSSSILRRTLWLLAVAAFVVGPATYTTLNPPTTQCPPECARCGHAWGPSNTPWCKLKNMKGTK